MRASCLERLRSKLTSPHLERNKWYKNPWIRCSFGLTRPVTMPSVSSDALQTLQIAAISLACLTGLFGEAHRSATATRQYSTNTRRMTRTGVYLVIFALAIWSTYRQGTVSSKRLRWVTIVLYVHASLPVLCLTLLRSFVDLCIHFVTRSLQFSRARLLRDSNEEFLRWSIPLTVIGK